ncbi:aminotransferase class IV [Haloferula sp. A504]|uniref:aminotransferase class IV n=1 Tax=Haloferula sp. A504 TaxID=3373601 RepID=UPI0031C92D6D|nr:aminotransferase class IV [Verrucomicrobiaceae bacterium E54]
MKTWLLGEPGGAELLHDRALTHGLGVFETLLAVDGRLVRADLHLERLRSGCARLGIPAPEEKAVLAGLEPVLAEIVAPRMRVRVMQTAGPGGLRELAGGSPRTLLSIEALGSVSSTIAVATSPWPRNEGSPLAGVKCSSYAESLVALDHARRAGVDELIFPNTRGMLCEAATANVFVIKDGNLVTPPLASGCLPGTTRQRVIEWAPGLGIECEERPVTMDEARQAEGLFLTSSTRGVVWVRQWDDRVFLDRRLADLCAAEFERSLAGD